MVASMVFLLHSTSTGSRWACGQVGKWVHKQVGRRAIRKEGEGETMVAECGFLFTLCFSLVQGSPPFPHDWLLHYSFKVSFNCSLVCWEAAQAPEKIWQNWCD